MQKPERKQHKDRRPSRRLALAAALLLLAGGVAAAVLLSRPQEQPAPEEKHWGMLTERQSEELTSITVQRRGEAPWTLVRTEDGSLRPENDASWTVSDQQASLLQETVTRLRYEEVLADVTAAGGGTNADGEAQAGAGTDAGGTGTNAGGEAQAGTGTDAGGTGTDAAPDPAASWQNTPEDFGLADPRVTVTARFTDGTELTLHIGSDTGLEEEWHYMTVEGDSRLFAVSSAVAADLDVEYALLRPVPKPDIVGALLDRITVYDSEKVIAEWQLVGSVEDRDAGCNWEVTTPFRAPADEEAIANLKKSAGDLRLGAWLAPATEENLDRYGFDIPRRVLLFHMAAGSTGTISESGVYDVTDHEEKTVELIVGGSPDDLASWVRFGDDLYTVSAFTLEAFADPDPLSTVARYPVLTPLDSLESLTVEENGEILEYVLQESTAEAGTATESTAAAESGTGSDSSTATESTASTESAATRQCFLNGEEIPYETFAAAYERLLTVTYSGRLPEDTDLEALLAKEPYKKYTFRTLSGGTHTVLLRQWDDMHDAVTVDGSTLFYLIRGGMTDLPEGSASC